MPTRAWLFTPTLLLSNISDSVSIVFFLLHHHDLSMRATLMPSLSDLIEIPTDSELLIKFVDHPQILFEASPKAPRPLEFPSRPACLARSDSLGPSNLKPKDKSKKSIAFLKSKLQPKLSNFKIRFPQPPPLSSSSPIKIIADQSTNEAPSPPSTLLHAKITNETSCSSSDIGFSFFDQHWGVNGSYLHSK